MITGGLEARNLSAPFAAAMSAQGGALGSVSWVHADWGRHYMERVIAISLHLP